MSDIQPLDADSCGEDVEDLVYLAERFGVVSDIQLSPEGSVESFFFEPTSEWDAAYGTSPMCYSSIVLASLRH